MSQQPGRAGDGVPPGAGGQESPDAAADRPATYREVFAVGEFRALYASGALSSIGDYLGKVALAALVYQATDSVVYSAASLAITYLPWLTGAPFLVALAERYPRRRVMIISDLARLALVGVAAVPGLPLPLVPALMFLAAVVSPPFDASRSALLPTVLSGDRYVLGMSLTMLTGQATQVAGFVFGGLLSAVDANLALGIDSATFGVSALLIGLAVRPRPAVARTDTRRHLLRETAQGFTIVYGSPVLRSVAIVILCGVAFAVLPEGLAAGWSGELRTGTFGQGLIMASGPLGVVVGGIVVGRLLSPPVRRRMIRPLALLVPASLVAALADPPLPVVMVLAALTGFAMSVILPANALFVQALPNAYRARAFGVMQGGLQLVQGFVMLAGGVVAGYVGVPRTVGLWALFGLAVMIAASALWPRQAAFDEAIDAARAANSRAEATGDDQTGPAPRNDAGATGPDGGSAPAADGGAGATAAQEPASGASPSTADSAPAGTDRNGKAAADQRHLAEQF